MSRPHPHTPAPMFQSDKARQYDRRMQQAIPGYDTLHHLTGLLVAQLTADSGAARVLVAGAGTGTECIALAEANPALTVVGVDPADDMIAHAVGKVADKQLSDRIALYACTVDSMPEQPPFDAATLLLVLHFLPDNGAKLALLTAIARRMKPEAPLILADVTGGDWADPAQALLRQTWARLQQQAGMSEQDIARGFRMVERDIHPVTDLRQAELLVQAGFSPPQPFFRALCFTGILCRKLPVNSM